MKTVWLVVGVFVWSGWAQSAPLPRSPMASNIPEGKSVYLPLPRDVDPKSEKVIQQEGGVRGGRNEPMHSYALPEASQPATSHTGH